MAIRRLPPPAPRSSACPGTTATLPSPMAPAFACGMAGSTLTAKSWMVIGLFVAKRIRHPRRRRVPLLERRATARLDSTGGSIGKCISLQRGIGSRFIGCDDENYHDNEPLQPLRLGQ